METLPSKNRSVIKYRQTRRKFEVVDVNTLTADDKLEYVAFVAKFPEEKKRLLKESGITGPTLNKWIRNVERGVKLHSRGGAPNKLSDIHGSMVKAFVTARAEGKNAVSYQDVNLEIRKRSLQTQKDNNSKNIKLPCDNTVRKYSRALNLKPRSGEVIANARSNAELDPLNAASHKSKEAVGLQPGLQRRGSTGSDS
jgi:predicted PolB exonuclease-like 3'-5' exonuclease